MIKWEAVKGAGESWFVQEYSDNALSPGRLIILCGDDEALACRIARLPELEAEVESLVAALFTIRRLTMRRDGLEHVVRVACDAILSYDEIRA